MATSIIEGIRLNSNNYRQYSSSEDSEEDIVVCEDDRLVTVTVLDEIL